jgi:Amidohydrolase family
MELRMMHKLHRLHTFDLATPALSAYEALEIATLNGGKATGFADELGALVAGMKGDAILVDLDRVARDPWIDPEFDIADAFFAAAMPERMRSWINSRSNSAIPAIIVATIRPCGVDRSKAKPFIAMTDTRHVSSSFRVCRRSRVLRPQRESSVTSTASISRRWPAPLPSSARRDRAWRLSRFL